MDKGKLKKTFKTVGMAMLMFVIANMLLPTKMQNPVEGCGKDNYDPESFWHKWGDHKHGGIDIFAPEGTPIYPAIGGIVVEAHRNARFGGNCLYILSSSFRMHYYAHMKDMYVKTGDIVTKNTLIGSVGDTGNAKGKPHHLHYSITSILPQDDWRFQRQMKYFHINPAKELGYE